MGKIDHKSMKFPDMLDISGYKHCMTIPYYTYAILPKVVIAKLLIMLII